VKKFSQLGSQNKFSKNFQSKNFWNIFVSLVVVKIIRRFGFGPIYANQIVAIVVA